MSEVLLYCDVCVAVKRLSMAQDGIRIFLMQIQLIIILFYASSCESVTMLANVRPWRHGRIVANGTRGLRLKNNGHTLYLIIVIYYLDTAATSWCDYVLRHGIV